MAAEKEFGVVHIYGIRGGAAAVNLTVQSDDFDHKYALDVEVKDENGRVITDRLDDERTEVSIDGVVKTDGSESLLGGQFEYGGITFIIKGVTDRGTNNDYRKVSIKGVKYQEIA
jgi:hypothetical protein